MRIKVSLFSAWLIALTLTVSFPSLSSAQETHDHGLPETLGEVSFPITCGAAVQLEFDRAVALLHSFAYTPAEKAFREVAERDPKCAMAHWGIAMAKFHQLWEPQIAPDMISVGETEIRKAKELGSPSQRESALINALGRVFEGAPGVPYRTRAFNYERAMSDIAAANQQDVEIQVFYALSLLANASPADKTHAKQKQAVEVLDPLYRAYPKHPGIPHYIIHACDNSELANLGLPAARVYAKIAASAPHALHMPSHIFTRLGLWDDSIASNLAAKDAAHQQGDTGEELHAMDYLVYAYLQKGSDADAAAVLRDLGNIKLHAIDFKTGYASTAMPVRYAVERRQWADAINIVPPDTAPPHVVAIAIWARGMGMARNGRAPESQPEVDKLRQIEAQLRASGNEYWAAQVNIMMREIMAWSAQADKKSTEATALMRGAADAEDAIEKLPVTPGPIVPAREQLGELLLEQSQPEMAAKEFETALLNAPRRRGALQGKAHAAELIRQK
jgi:tetratricopeptide (TPR) repeat protein